jgi:hypothetical protein
MGVAVDFGGGCPTLPGLWERSSGRPFGLVLDSPFLLVSYFSLPSHTGSILTIPSSLPSRNKHELHTQSLGDVTDSRFTEILHIYPNLRI